MSGQDEVFADVLGANDAYAQGFRLAGLPARAAAGLAILTCMDSRIEPLPLLGLRPGDAKILRNAGARVTDDVLRTLVLASYLLGVDRVDGRRAHQVPDGHAATRQTCTRPIRATPEGPTRGASRS